MGYGRAWESEGPGATGTTAAALCVALSLGSWLPHINEVNPGQNPHGSRWASSQSGD